MAAIQDVQRGMCTNRRFFFFHLGALLRATLAVQNVGTGHFVVAAAHEAKFYLILDIFNVESAAAWA